MEKKHQKELKANKDTEIAEEFRKEFRRDISYEERRIGN